MNINRGDASPLKYRRRNHRLGWLVVITSNLDSDVLVSIRVSRNGRDASKKGKNWNSLQVNQDLLSPQ